MSRRTGLLVLVGMLVALVLAGVASFYASSSPDGLNRVAIDKGLDHRETAHGLRGSPLAGYTTRGVQDPRLSRGVAGVTGVALTFLLAVGVLLVVRRTTRRARTVGDDARGDEGAGGRG
jgi:cobalt/nickel transport system permease protein